MQSGETGEQERLALATETFQWLRARQSEINLGLLGLTDGDVPNFV